MTDNKKEKKVDVTVWLYPGLVRRVDGWLAEANCASRSEFVDRALRYYLGCLESEDVTEYLNAAIAATIRGTLDGYALRLRHLLFKWAVELNMLGRIVAALFRGDEIDRDELHALAEDEVRCTNGAVSLREDAEWRG